MCSSICTLALGIRFLMTAMRQNEGLAEEAGAAVMSACDTYLKQDDIPTGLALASSAIKIDEASAERIGGLYLEHARRLAASQEKEDAMRARWLLRRCVSMKVGASGAAGKLLEELGAGDGERIPLAAPVKGLLAHYPFNGNALDLSGNGQHAEVRGAIPTTDRFGDADSACYFDGKSAWIDCGDGIELADTSFSVVAWVKGVPRASTLVVSQGG